jgi:hypothetical protein
MKDDKKKTYCKSEAVLRLQVVGRIGGLDDHALAAEGIAGKVELVAGTAPGTLDAAARQVRGDEGAGEAVGEGVVDCPGLLVGAEVGRAAIAAGAGAEVDGLVVGRARLDRLGKRGLVGPGTRGLAAVPEARRQGLARVVEVGGEGRGSEQVQGEQRRAKAERRGRHGVQVEEEMTKQRARGMGMVI